MITPSLEAVWPDVERRLRALLYKRGLDQPSADDVVQEVALRVIDNDVTYDSPGDLLRWAAPVACRLHVDLLRHRARHVYPEEAMEPAARDDVAGQVADRLELQRALRGIARLAPADRAAIIEAVAGTAPASRQEAVRLAVRRHRARHRLAVVLEHLAAAFGALRLALRDRRTVALAALVPVVAMPFLVAVPHARPADAADASAQSVSGAVSRHEVVRARDAAVPSGPSTGSPALRAPVRPAAQSSEHEAVRVSAPAGLGLRAGTDRAAPGEHLVCVGGIPVVSQRVCVL